MVYLAVLNAQCFIEIISLVCVTNQYHALDSSGLIALFYTSCIGLLPCQGHCLLGGSLLYAPDAPVIPVLPYTHYCAAREVSTLARRRYWPFVVALAGWRAQLDDPLSQLPTGIRRGLAQLRKQGHLPSSVALVP